MKGKLKSFIVKMTFSILSFFFFLVLLEISLRFAARYYVFKRLPQQKEIILEIKNNPESCVVLCAGDSFTFGGGLPYSQTYPGQLSGIINLKNPNKKFIAINAGVCEYNSRQLLNFLPHWIQLYRPNLVVLLIGSANKFNLTGYNLETNHNLFSVFKRIITQLRVYKMARLLVLNLRGKSAFWNKIPFFIERDTDFLEDTTPTIYDLAKTYIEEKLKINRSLEGDSNSAIWFNYNTGKKEHALGLCKKALKDNPSSEENLCAMGYMYYAQGDYQKAAEYYLTAFKQNPFSRFSLSQLVFFYAEMGKLYLNQGKYDCAVECFCNIIEIEPIEHFFLYYQLTKAYDLQSKYDANYIVRIFQKSIDSSPYLRKNKVFMKYFNFFRNKQMWEGKINLWLENELDAIAKLCRDKNIKLVMQNYPVSYPMANKAILKIAQKYSLVFVDNLSVFHKLLCEEKKEVYFLDDNHCTVQGYRVMAENIYGSLVSNGLIGK